MSATIERANADVFEMLAHRRERGLFNGAVWESPTKMRATLQYLTRDQWCLMSEPMQAVERGRMVCLAQHDVNGRWLYTLEELAARLTLIGWTFLPHMTIAPLCEVEARPR